MKWLFGQSPGAKELPAEVQKTLEAEFRLGPQEVSRLRCVQRSGEFAGRSVLLIRIFDPGLLGSTGKPVGRYEDMASHSQALLFEGHIEKGKGSPLVSLTDKRPPKGSSTAGGSATRAG